MKIKIEVDTDLSYEVDQLVDFLQRFSSRAIGPDDVAKVYGEGSPVHVRAQGIVEAQPAPPAPVAPVAPAEAPDMRDVDANGMPWDKRIHARTRAITSGGVWRIKRGVDKGLVRQVEAELMGVQAQPAPPAPAAEAQPAPPAPAAEAQPVPAPPAPPAALPATFPEFMKWVAVKNKKYTETDGLNELVSKVGLPSIGLLAVNLNYIPTLVDIVEAETK